MHVNRQVREAVKTRLDATALFASVSTNRSANLVETELPAAIIGTGLDEVEQATKDGRERRAVTLTVVVVADGAEPTLDDDLDALRVGIELALSDQLGGLVTNMAHTGGELDLGTDEDGERWFAFLVLSWTLQVWTQRGDPETAL